MYMYLYQKNKKIEGKDYNETYLKCSASSFLVQSNLPIHRYYEPIASKILLALPTTDSYASFSWNHVRADLSTDLFH